MKSKFLALPLFLGLALTVGACAPSGTDDPAEAPVEDPAVAPTEYPAETPPAPGTETPPP